MAITKCEFLDACASGDSPTVQQYLAQPEVVRQVTALERMLCDDNGSSSCSNIRAASRTMMAATRGLWFCGDHNHHSGQWGHAIRVALVNHHPQIVEWFFTSAFASTIPITLQVVFSHVAKHAVARRQLEMLEILLNSWVFCVAMAPPTREAVLCTLRMDAVSQSDHQAVDLLLAHGASIEPMEGRG